MLTNHHICVLEFYYTIRMKWIICSLALVSVATVQAQRVAVSPYSAYGIGEMLYDNNTEQGGMGGISTVPTNAYGQSANFSNPAANKNLRMTSFNVSYRGENYSFKTEADKQSSSKSNISNLSMAFPTGENSSFGIGFQPFSGLGYEIANQAEINQIKQSVSMKGEGGINSLHAFYSQNLNKQFTVGIRANYLFGELKRNEIVGIEGASLVTDYENESDYRGVQVTLGTMYTKKLTKDNTLSIGATYTLPTNLRTDVRDVTSTYTFSGMDPNPATTDIVASYRDNKAKTKLPQTIALGASYSKENTWSIATEVKYNTWSDFEKPTFGEVRSLTNGTEYKNNVRLAVGGYWIPDFKSYKSYFNRVIYRAGGYYQGASYAINGTDINSYGLTLGAGLPIGKSNDASTLNLSFEYGQRGTKSNNLVKEDYVGVKVAFDITDIWFRKRVID